MRDISLSVSFLFSAGTDRWASSNVSFSGTIQTLSRLKIIFTLLLGMILSAVRNTFGRVICPLGLTVTTTSWQVLLLFFRVDCIYRQ